MRFHSNCIKLRDILLLLSFFISGASALIYQTCWQRSLYSVIGVDIDSITIIVSVFMLGIGIGGMTGGWLADRFSNSRLRFYIFAEISIAIYGALSLKILGHLESILNQISSNSAGLSALACIAFLIIPTILMGMTLPLLTIALNEKRGNIGVSIGRLYFLNTMGAAAGAAATPFIFFPNWSLHQVIWIGVAGNLLVAFLATASIHWLSSRQGVTV